MNKKGQTLILFVLLVPILITILAIVVDVGLLTNEFQKTRGLVDDGIKEYFRTQKKDEITNLLELNEIPTEYLEILEKENSIEVNLTYEMDSLFGKLIRLNHYPIEIHRVGMMEEDRVIIRKKE